MLLYLIIFLPTPRYLMLLNSLWHNSPQFYSPCFVHSYLPFLHLKATNLSLLYLITPVILLSLPLNTTHTFTLPFRIHTLPYTNSHSPPPSTHTHKHTHTHTHTHTQTQREREHAPEIHRAFQRDLCKMRLETSRAYVKTLTDGQMVRTTVRTVLTKYSILLFSSCHAVLYLKKKRISNHFFSWSQLHYIYTWNYLFKTYVRTYLSTVCTAAFEQGNCT